MCARFFGVQPASGMTMKAWICAPATVRDLESGFSESISVRTREVVNRT